MRNFTLMFLLCFIQKSITPNVFYAHRLYVCSVFGANAQIFGLTTEIKLELSNRVRPVIRTQSTCVQKYDVF